MRITLYMNSNRRSIRYAVFNYTDKRILIDVIELGIWFTVAISGGKCLYCGFRNVAYVLKDLHIRGELL